MQGNYERLIEKISRLSGLSHYELGEKIEEKKNKLSGMISKEGAAQIVASELGISFDQEKLKINELIPGMRKVRTTGKILKISPIRTFQTKNGKESKVVNIQIADDTGNIKMVLWDVGHIAFFENGQMFQGSVVEVKNASMRDSELHLGSFSEIKLSEENFDKLVTDKNYSLKNISELKRGESTKVRAFITQIFEPKFFSACSECGKKVENEKCLEHQSAEVQKRMILNMFVDDGTEAIRAVFFNEIAKSIGFHELDREKIQMQIENLLGKEMIFSGNIKLNSFFNNLEISVENAEEINLDGLLAEFERR